MLDEQGARPRFILAGEWVQPEDRVAATRFVDAAGLAGSVSFPGLVCGSQKARLLSVADIFVFPTYYPLEGQPLAILEAMAASLPVVSTPRAAIPDCVIHGETGVLVQERSSVALVEALKSLILDPEARMRLGHQGRIRYLDHFTWTRSAQRFVAAIDEALEHRSGDPGARALRAAGSEDL